MKTTKNFVTYAQYNEDIILLALLSDVKNGFYVDVGANYPTIDSVTKLFYEKGWSGINIEPIKHLFDQIEKERPRDINLNIGAGSKNEEKVFYENLKESGHSSFIEEQAVSPKAKLSKTKIKIQTLESILAKHANKKRIHFMKIDVEGFETEVIAGSDWKKFRPEVICIEANHAKEDWRKILISADYKLFIADGLNEYYIAKESWGRTEGFVECAVSLDYNVLKQHQYEAWDSDKIALAQHIKHVEAQDKEIRRLAEMSYHSLKNQTYPRRLKRAIYGLTIGWLRDKK